jgi:hypothetical protein
MDVSDSYWKFRRARLAVKRPEFALLDLLLFSGRRDQKEKLSYFDSCKEMYKLGEYYTDRTFEKISEFFKKLRSKPESVIDASMRLRDKDWEDLDRSEANSENRSEANFGDDGDPGFAGRMNEPSTDVGPARSQHGGRVWFNPDNPENRVQSNKVGPERQLRENTDPWPLAKPDEDKADSSVNADKRDPFAIEDQRDEKTKNDTKATEKATEKASDKSSGESDSKSDKVSDTPAKKADETKVSSIDEARKKREAKEKNSGKDKTDAGQTAQDRARKKRKRSDDLEL